MRDMTAEDKQGEMAKAENPFSKQKKQIKQVIVVEGKSDTQRLNRLYQVTTIETNGQRLMNGPCLKSRKLMNSLGWLSLQIQISQALRFVKLLWTLYLVFNMLLLNEMRRSQAIREFRVEHASDKAIEKALANVYQLADPEGNAVEPIAQKDLIALRLIGTPDAKDRREYLSSQLHLGYVNGKQLAKRLALFRISLDQVAAVLENYQKK